MKCQICSCVIPPDSDKCPNCGLRYIEGKPSDNIKLGRTGFNLNCNTHGHIHITAKVASPPTRCPFC